MKDEACSFGLGLWSALGLLFIALRLCGVIEWSWWWVLAPFWGPALTGFVLVLFLAILAELSKGR
jgi:hypothetical protein